MPVIGFLDTASPDTFADRLRAFRQGLRETGYIEGENVRSNTAGPRINRSAAGAGGRIGSPPGRRDRRGRRHRLRRCSKGGNHDDPHRLRRRRRSGRLGLVASLARPGGNLTGVNFFNVELAAKRLELLRELIPGSHRVAVLVNPVNAANTETTLRDVERRPAPSDCKSRSSTPARAAKSMPPSQLLRASGRGAVRRHRSIFHQPARPIVHTGRPPRDSRDHIQCANLPKSAA